MTDHRHARLEWDAQGQPRSAEFGDVYFSRASGLEESRQVFLASNRLAERFAALRPGAVFCIGETGFGTGLNFLCAWQLFAACASPDARLHFVSTERYPLTLPDLRRALALWPELAPFAEALSAQYQAIHPGFQHLHFAAGRVRLTLLVGDVLDTLPHLDAAVDAWFLDGFAPARNPRMWTPELFAQLARLSRPGTTLATFTSAGFVRRGLLAAGFAVARVKGFGHKREMLAGPFAGPASAAPTPWFARPPKPPRARQALVIGAGLAGCASAASLAMRGWQVTLIERHAQVAAEASGNPQGVLYLKLSAHHTALSQLVVSGFGHTRRLLQHLERGRDWDGCGVLQLAFSEQQAARQAQLAAAFPAGLLRPVQQAEAEALAGVALPAGGLFFPQAGWVHPPALCRQLVAHPNIRVLSNREALGLRREAGLWRAFDAAHQLAAAPVCVLAGAAEVQRFVPWLPLKRIRGQITRLPASAASGSLRSVLCAEGYVAPPRQGEHTLGASFDFHAQDLTPSEAEHAGNLRLLKEISPDLATRLGADCLDPALLDGRVAFRCSSPDYLPIVGPLADADAFVRAYAALAKDARKVPEAPCPWLDGLYVNTAHGSRGLLSAPLCGELLAAWLCDEPLPLPRPVAEACHPNRFVLRRLIRGG